MVQAWKGHARTHAHTHTRTRAHAHTRTRALAERESRSLVIDCKATNRNLASRSNPQPQRVPHVQLIPLLQEPRCSASACERYMELRYASCRSRGAVHPRVSATWSYTTLASRTEVR